MHKTVLVFTYSCIYVCKYPRTHTHAAWIHAYQCHWVDTIPNTFLSIQNQQFEHVNAAGRYSVKLNMLLMLDWADMHPGSVRYCGSIHMQIQFVVLVAQCPSTFCLFCYISIRIKIQLHVMSRYPSISICCSCGSITHLNSGVKVRYLSKRVNTPAVCT